MGEIVGDRMRFKKTWGRGPDSGWVSLKLSGRELLVRAGAAKNLFRRRSDELFRAVVRVQDMHHALSWADAGWKRRNDVIDLVQAISGRLDAAAMDPPSDKAMYDALMAARAQMSGLWNSG